MRIQNFSPQQFIEKLKHRLKRKQQKTSTNLKTKVSIGRRVFRSFIITVLVGVATVGISSYYLANTIIEDKVRDASEQTIIQAGKKLEYMFEQYNQLTVDFALNEELHDHLHGLFNNDGESTGKNTILLNKVQDILLNTSIVDKNLSLHLLIPDHNMIISPQYIKSEEQEAIMNSDWYRVALESGEDTVWIGAGEKLGESNSGFSINTVKFAKTVTSGRQTFIILFELSTDLFKENFQDISFGEDGSVKIVDENNRVVFSFDEEEIGQDNHYPILPNEAVHSFEKDGQIIFQYKPEKTDWYLTGAVHAKELTEDTQSIMSITASIIILAVIVSIFTGRRVANMVGRPVGEITELMAAAEEGDFSVRSQFTNRKDEFGLLAVSFNEMLEKTAAMVRKTREAARKVLHVATELTEISQLQLEAAREVAAASEEITGGAVNLTEKAENGNLLAEKINHEVENVYNINQEMEKYAQQIQESSHAGVQKMQEMVEQTTHTEQMTLTLRDTTASLRNSTNQISEIMDILTSIADQTNLLALNAAIEAARAGEAGRGFAVVANEIRSLSSQSQESIETVGKITAEIIQNVNETIALLEEASPIFKEQVDKATETNEILQQVENRMNEYTEKIAHVSRSIRQLRNSQEELYETISEVSATAEESSAISEELTASTEEQTNISDSLVSRADELKDLSEELQKILDQFKV